MLCFYDFIVIKIPFVVCAFAHTIGWLFVYLETQFFVCFCFSVQTFALVESQQTKRTERNGKNWCKQTNRFHLNFCSLCCGLLFTLLCEKWKQSFWANNSLLLLLLLVHWEKFTSEGAHRSLCMPSGRQPSISPRHSIISLFHYSLIEITSSKANDAQFSLWLLENPDAV